MPAYNAAPPTILEPDVLQSLWSVEALSNGAKSQQVCLRRDGLPICLSVELLFAADPGAFQVDLQTADVDLDTHYVTKTSISSGLNASFVGRIEVVNVVARFARLLLVSKANVVNTSAKMGR